MKLLLLQPPIRDFYDTDIRLQPIGLCYLKSAVHRRLPQVEVIVKDYHHNWGRRTLSVPNELAYLKDFYPWPDKSPFSAFYHYYHFGASFEKIAVDVAAERPDIVGISSMFSPYYREVLATAREIKKRLDIPIVVGGSHVSAAPLSMLKHQCVDFVVRGEGERPLVNLLQAMENGHKYRQVPNLGYKENGVCVLNKIQENYPLKEIPTPDFSQFPPESYLFEGKPLCFVLTSRGCPHRCSFCSVHLTFGKYRWRPVKDTLEEIRLRYRQGYRVFDFEDDNLTFHIEEMKELCVGLMDSFPKRDVQFLAMNGISYLSLDEQLLALMKQAGFSRLNLSLVSADQSVRKFAGRPHTLQKYLQVVKIAQRLGLKIVSYQILGLPGEKLDSMIDTLALGAGLPVLLGASMFYLPPGSPIAGKFPESLEDDLFKARLTAMAIETGDFCREHIYTLFITTRIVNFLKGICIDDNSVSLAQALAVAKEHGAREKIGAKLLEKLFAEKLLYASTKNDLHPLSRFDFELFLTVWLKIKRIVTLQGKTIKLEG